MNPVQSTYKINSKTLALLPAKHIAYDTIVLEEEKTIYTTKTPFQLIKEACIQACSTYDGRREAIIHHTGFKQKTPIPISIVKRIYMFPTHSPNHMENIWIANNHIIKFTAISKTEAVIQFKGGRTLHLDVSKHIIQTQHNRTLQCMFKLEAMKGIRGKWFYFS